jgi:hypothetical protein
MPVEIDGDHLPALRENGQHLAEHVHRAQAPVEEQERFALTKDPVVVVHAIGLDITATLGQRRRRFRRGSAFRGKIA